MKRVRVATVLFVLVILLALAFVRFAPINMISAHKEPQLGQPIKQAATIDQSGGFYTSRILDGFPGENMRQIDEIIRNTPRTSVVAGSVSSGMVTYVTRSRILGFPDLTTVKVELTKDGTHLWLWGRLKYGLSDYDVNKRRILGWLQQL